MLTICDHLNPRKMESYLLTHGSFSILCINFGRIVKNEILSRTAPGGDRLRHCGDMLTFKHLHNVYIWVDIVFKLSTL